MALDISGAVLFTFRGLKKKGQIFGLAIAGRNGLSVKLYKKNCRIGQLFSRRSVHICQIITD